MAHLPKYRRHSSRDIGFVEIRRRRIYLPGRYGSRESRDAYLRHLQELHGEEIAPPATATVAGLAEQYLDYARVYYGNTEYDCLVGAVRVLVDEYANALTEDFGPLMFRRVRSKMIVKDWSRNYINHQVARLRRVFKWGIEHELLPPSVLQGLQAMAPLRAGRTQARETEPVEPVDLAHAEATAAMSTTVVAAMIRLQMITGMRSANLVTLRPYELDTSKEVWLYRPPQHKSAWRGRILVVPIGPRAQEILCPFLGRNPKTFCFSPRESEAERKAALRTLRMSPVQPSQQNRSKPQARQPSIRYTTKSYRQAVGYACLRASVPTWTPHQLRHTVATAVRSKYGLEGAQCYLGHGHADVTQIYTARDVELACSIARAVG